MGDFLCLSGVYGKGKNLSSWSVALVSLLVLSSQHSRQSLWGSHHTWKAMTLARAQFFLVAFLPLAVTIKRQSPPYVLFFLGFEERQWSNFFLCTHEVLMYSQVQSFGL